MFAEPMLKIFFFGLVELSEQLLAVTNEAAEEDDEAVDEVVALCCFLASTSESLGRADEPTKGFELTELELPFAVCLNFLNKKSWLSFELTVDDSLLFVLVVFWSFMFDEFDEDVEPELNLVARAARPLMPLFGVDDAAAVADTFWVWFWGSFLKFSASLEFITPGFVAVVVDRSVNKG
jgi:hypothetical protein